MLDGSAHDKPIKVTGFFKGNNQLKGIQPDWGSPQGISHKDKIEWSNFYLLGRHYQKVAPLSIQRGIFAVKGRGILKGHGAELSLRV